MVLLEQLDLRVHKDSKGDTGTGAEILEGLHTYGTTGAVGADGADGVTGATGSVNSTGKINFDSSGADGH